MGKLNNKARVRAFIDLVLLPRLAPNHYNESTEHKLRRLRSSSPRGARPPYPTPGVPVSVPAFVPCSGRRDWAPPGKTGPEPSVPEQTEFGSKEYWLRVPWSRASEPARRHDVAQPLYSFPGLSCLSGQRAPRCHATYPGSARAATRWSFLARRSASSSVRTTEGIKPSAGAAE